MMIPFGETILLWRASRGLTQAALAQTAGVTRPNLSGIERGKREVTLTTLRALANALDVQPGILVDGVPPRAPAGSLPFSRAALERIADAVIGGNRLHAREECVLVELLRTITRHKRLAAARQRGTYRRGHRVVETAWLTLKASYPAEVVHTLLRRIEARLAPQ